MRRRFDVMFYLPSITPLLVENAATPAGGGETQVILLARALAATGLRVCVVAYPAPGLPDETEGVTVIARSASRAEQRLIGRIREATAIFRVLLSVRARTVVVRVASAEVGVVAIFSKLLRRRFVYSSASLLDFRPRAWGLRRRDAALFRLVLRVADRVVVQTLEQREKCVETVGREATVIPSVAEPIDVVGTTSGAFVWVGRIYPNKRPLAFLELAAALPDAQFQMIAVPRATDSELMAQVTAMADGLSNVELLDPMVRSVVRRVIAQGVAVVSTSEFEGMPNVFLEGWTAGVPALALAHDPDNVIAEHGLGVCADGSQRELESAARRLRSDSAWRAELSARCIAYVHAHHSPDAVAAAWAEVLEFETPASQPAELAVDAR
jgi:glycosyltransferase involved in cell wall biosynthesis